VCVWQILNEVQFLHKLDSPFVLKFFNWYESQNHIWLIFEYCIGGDLLNLITQDKRLPEAAVKVRCCTARTLHPVN
jgi:serine/threonine-protein kinase ULK4